MATVASLPRGDATSRRMSGGGLLSPAFLDELRARTSLSALIGRSMKLTKAGREYKGCCPFHQEKTPSFYINDEKAFYHCFGCGAHGDAIRFLTEANGLPFMDAVKELATAAGLEIPAPDPAARARAERTSGLVGVSEQAAAWYRQQLNGIEGAAARAYLDRRGIGAHAREAFALGFAPDGRTRLAAAITSTKEDELVEAGLLIKPDADGPGGGKAYDRFRGRLMIPIRDARGRTIAFGGRILDAGEPKYLNSPDTPLFDKGRTLFNLDRAGPLARKKGRILVVEGYLDVIALDQAGIGEAVAPLGTALTEAQMARLWSIVDAPILCFDGDGAGRKAGLRAATRALPILMPGKTLRFAMLPTGQDPDDLVKAGGADAFEAAIADPVPLDVLLYTAERDAGDMARPEARAGLRQRLHDLASTCGDRLMQEEFRRSFNSLFFEDFGWKKVERKAIASNVLRAQRSEEVVPTEYKLIESALYELSRRPARIAPDLEPLAGMTILYPKLAEWRDILISAALREPALDDDAITSILDATWLPEVMQFDLQRGLRFSFMLANVAPELRNRQLSALIRKLFEDSERGVTGQMLNAESVSKYVNEEYDEYLELLEETVDFIKQRGASDEAAADVNQIFEER